MILSQTSEIAVRALAFIATHQQTEQGICAKDLADSIKVNQHTVAKAMQILVKHGVVSSARGRSGGFYLTAPQKDKPIVGIVEAIDGKWVFNKCALGLHQCSKERPCPIHGDFRKAKDIITKIFSQTSIKDISITSGDGRTFLY